MENHISNTNKNSYVELGKYVGAERRVDEISTQVKERIRNLKAIEKAAVEFRNAHAKLNSLWLQDFDTSEVLSPQYPFKQSFDDIQIDEWIESIKTQIKMQLDELA